MWGKRIKVTGQGRIHFLLGFGSYYAAIWVVLSFYGLLDFLASGSNRSINWPGGHFPSFWRPLYMYGTYSSWRLN